MSAQNTNIPKQRFKSPRTILALMLREMATSYGRSPLGYLWAIAEPVAGTILLAFVFSLAFRAPPLGTNFALFYATGLLPYLMYNDLANKISAAIRFSKPLLFYPSVTFLDAIIARFLLNAMTHILVFLIVISAILVIFDVQVIVDVSTIASALFMAMMLGLGVGVLNCFLMSVYPSWERVWMILNRPLFIISCVLFILESVPEPYRSWLWFNPLVHVTTEMRKGFYASYSGDGVSYIYLYGVALICLVLGLLLLGRFHRDILNT